MKLTKKEKEYVKKIKYTNNYMDTKKTFKKKIISTFEIQRIEEEIYNKTDKDKPFNKKLINVLNYQRRMKHKGKKYPHNIIIDYIGFYRSRIYMYQFTYYYFKKDIIKLCIDKNLTQYLEYLE